MKCLGEVYRPEDLVGGKKKLSDLSPLPSGIAPSLLDVICEVRLLSSYEVETNINK